MKSRFLSACLPLLLLVCAPAPVMIAADAQPAASPGPEEVLKNAQKALDDLATKTDAGGLYAIVDGDLLKLLPPGPDHSMKPEYLKKSQTLSSKPYFILFNKEPLAPPVKPDSLFGFEWRFLDIKGHSAVSFTAQPVPGHEDMLLLAPKEELKPGLFSIVFNHDDYSFGVETPDEETFWREVIRDNPGSWHTHSHLGALLWGRHDKEGALVEWKKAAELGPRFFETHNNYALALAATGHTDEALEEYKKAVAAGGIWNVRANYAQALLSAKHYDEAIRQYSAVDKMQPGYPGVFCREAECYLALEEWDVAEACCQMALKIRPDDPEAKQELEIAQKKMKERTAALESIWRGN